MSITTTTTPPETARIGHESTRSHLGFVRPDHSTGLRDWLTTVDHKKIGAMYAIFALAFLVFGGIEALFIRAQLAVAENNLVSAQTYNQLFTMHGTTMVFLAVMPLSSAFFNFLVPLQIGARDVAFPRLNAFSLWTFVAGAIIVNISWLFQAANASAWFNPADGHDGHRALGRLVRLRPADRGRVLGHRYGLLDLRTSGARDRLHRRLAEFHRHDHQLPRSRA